MTKITKPALFLADIIRHPHFAGNMRIGAEAIIARPDEPREACFAAYHSLASGLFFSAVNIGEMSGVELPNEALDPINQGEKNRLDLESDFLAIPAEFRNTARRTEIQQHEGILFDLHFHPTDSRYAMFSIDDLGMMSGPLAVAFSLGVRTVRAVGNVLSQGRIVNVLFYRPKNLFEHFSLIDRAKDCEDPSVGLYALDERSATTDPKAIMKLLAGQGFFMDFPLGADNAVEIRKKAITRARKLSLFT